MTAGRLAERATSAVHETAVLRVRPATPRDLDAVVELRIALLRARTETILLAELGSEVVGILRCVESMGSPLLEPSRYAYVSSAYVRPDVRRRGVLRAMMAEADRWCRARGLEQMRLHNVAGSVAAERAWDALGFAIVEQVRLRSLHASG